MANRVYLIVGPSGVGKTDTCALLEKCDGEFERVDLDRITNVHTNIECALVKGKEKIIELEQKNDNIIYSIDLGAGFQNQLSFRETITERRNKVIAIYAESDICYERKHARGGESRTHAEYQAVEYSKERKDIYNLNVIVNADQQIDTVVEELRQVIVKNQ